MLGQRKKKMQFSSTLEPSSKTRKCQENVTVRPVLNNVKECWSIEIGQLWKTVWKILFHERKLYDKKTPKLNRNYCFQEIIYIWLGGATFWYF